MLHPSPDLIATIDQAENIQDWLRSELISRGQEPLPFVGSLSQDMVIEEAANQIRRSIRFDISRNERNWEESLRRQIEHIEDTGVLVMRNGVVGVNNESDLIFV